MTGNSQSIFDAALSLPPETRAELVERLLDTLVDTDRAEIAAAWADEARRRLDAFDRDEMGSTPADELRTVPIAG